MKGLWAIAILAGSLTMVGCGKATSENADYNGVLRTTEPMSGKIDGTTWAYASGKASLDPFDSSRIQVELWEEYVADPCTSYHMAERKVIFSLPIELGDYRLSLSRNFTMYSYSNGANNNRIATKGMLRVTEISELQVTGALVGSYDSKNHVNGAFGVPFCR